MKVTVCQVDPRPGQLEGSLAVLRAHVQAAGTDFLLLPELCFSAWLAIERIPDARLWLASVAEHERHVARLADLGARAVVGTRPIVTALGSRRNQAYLWEESAADVVPKREKYYLPDEPGYWEASWYDRGEKRFDLGRALGMRIGVLVCTEMWFMEWARHYAAERADVLCVPRATPYGSTDVWLAGGRAAAVCSGAFCLSSNLWYPPASETDCGGLGWIVDPDGVVLARTDAATPFATVTIDLEHARAAKHTYPRYVSE